MEQLLKVGEVGRQAVAEQECLILLYRSVMALCMYSIRYICYLLFGITPRSLLLVSTNFRIKYFLRIYRAESIIYFIILPILCSFYP